MSAVAGAPTYAVILFAYLVVMFGIGVVAQRVIRTPNDFWVAGRQLGSGVLTGTLSATLISSLTTIGLAGHAYRVGWSAWLTSSGMWVGPLLLLVAAHFLVRFMGHTVADIFEARYGVATRLAAAAITVLGSFAFMSVQMYAMGTVLALIFNWPLTSAMLATSLVFIVYVVAGGLVAVAWTDCVQAVMLMAGLVWLGVTALGRVGGIGGLQSQLAVISPGHPGAWSQGQSPLTAFAMALAFAISVAAQPWHLTRAFSARDTTAIRSALANSALMTMAAATLATVIGLAGRVLVGDGTVPGDAILPYLATQLLHPAAGGLIIAALIAAIMSTADSVLLAAGTSVAKDFYQRFLEPEASPAQLLSVTRLSMVVAGMLGVIVALGSPGTVLTLGTFVFGAIGAALGVPLFMGCWWRRGTTAGAIAAMVLGPAGVALFTRWTVGVPAMAMGVAVSLSAYVVGSLMSPPQYARADRCFERIGRKALPPDAAGLRRAG